MDKIICIGKNYLDHAKELGDAVPETPVLFLKPPSVLFQVPKGGEICDVKLPVGRGSVHHECEIVLRLNSFGNIEAVTLGLDLTLRDVQTECKKKSLPWEVSKVFSNSAIVGPWIPIDDFARYLSEEFKFLLKDSVRQVGHGQNMRFSPQVCIDYAKSCFGICDGDMLFTGTPAGVGPLCLNDIGEIQWGSFLNYKIKFV